MQSVLWRVAKCLSYIEEARCLKVNTASGMVTLCKWPSGAQVEFRTAVLSQPVHRTATYKE